MTGKLLNILLINSKCLGCKLFIDHFAHILFLVLYPGWNRRWNDLPVSILLVHFKHDPVSPVVNNINGKQGLLRSDHLAEIKFPQASIGLNKTSELYIFNELHLLLISINKL